MRYPIHISKNQGGFAVLLWFATWGFRVRRVQGFEVWVQGLRGLGSRGSRFGAQGFSSMTTQINFLDDMAPYYPQNSVPPSTILSIPKSNPKKRVPVLVSRGL